MAIEILRSRVNVPQSDIVPIEASGVLTSEVIWQQVRSMKIERIGVRSPPVG